MCMRELFLLLMYDRECVGSLAGVYVGSTTLMLSSCISGSHSNLKGEYDLVSGFHPSQFVLFHHRMKLQGDIRIYLLDSCKSMDQMHPSGFVSVSKHLLMC